jgi:hypothetical protein
MELQRESKVAELLVGLAIVALGAIVCFMGLRVFFVALPIWGFLVGFYLGSAGITSLLGDSFLSTGISWIVGFVAGLVFAALSYVFWYVGAILAAGSTGALVGSGIMAAINVENVWIVSLAALAGAVLIALIAIIIALPIYIVIINTAFVGATAVVAGVMLVFNTIELEGLSRGSAWAIINESWLWAIAWVIVAAIGLSLQLRAASLVLLPEDRWQQARPAA